MSLTITQKIVKTNFKLKKKRKKEISKIDNKKERKHKKKE